MGRLKAQKRVEDALRRHDMQLVIWMIDSGEVPVDVEANDGDTPLLHAVAYNQIDVLDLLLDRGVNVNAANRHGKTALMKAAATTDVDTTDAVNILLRRGANIFAKDPSGKTALDWARRTNNVHVSRRLELAVQAHIVAHRVTHANQEAAAQHDAIAQMNDALTSKLHALLSPYAPHEVLALVTSAAVSHDMYSAAFPNGPPFFVNAESAQGWTALTKAASVDDVEGLRCLLQHGAMVDYESKLRHTALTWASYSGHTNAVQLLLQHRARVEYMTREKMTALSHASRNGKAHVVAILLGKYRERFLPQSSQPDYVSNEASEWHTHFLHHVLAEDVVGKSAMAYATAGGHTDVVALIQGACDQARAHETHVTTLQAKTRVVACALGCGTENAHDLIGYHEAHKCPRRDVACEKCKEHMQSQHLAEHEKRTCAYRDVTCVNLQFGCAAVLPWRTMQLHQSEHCHYRPVECRLECGKVLQWQARPQHEANECPLRTIACPACEHAMLGQDLKKHKRSACSKRLVECKLYGGCGEIHTFEDTGFHTESLCIRRKRPCHWASHGCDAVLGPPEARHIHEDTTCPFRIVSCRNDCGVSNLIATFLDEHLAWDCPKEIKLCPLGCGARMEAQYIYGHYEPHCGDCPKRVTRCPYDLCGKKMCFFGDTRWDAEETTCTRSDMAPSGVDVTRNGVLTRLQHLATYLDEKVSSFALVQAQAYLRTWLEARQASLLEAYHARDLDRIELGMVVKYDPETTQHYVSFRGRVVWVNLNYVYHALDPAVLATDWVCPSMAASARLAHVATVCPLQSVACPNECGQRCPKFQLEHHLKERCSKRILVCRLGCHKALTMEALLEHEESECPKSQRFCPHCHEPCLLEAIESHVRMTCLQFPRSCRLTCGAQVPRASFDQHEATVCPKRLVPCPRCQAHVFACDLASHESNECPQRPFGMCELGCGMHLCVNQVQSHVLQDCPHRAVICPQCATTIQFSIFDHHVKFDCAQRELYCHKGCGTRIRECDVAKHDLDDCMHRPTYCPLHCGIELAMSQLPRHMQADCVRRLVSCPNRCGAKVPAIQLPGHLRSCDHHKVPCGAGSVACTRPLKAWIVRERLVPCFKHRLHGFMWALKCGDMDVVLGFLSKIALDEVDAEFETGYTPLVLACAKGDVLLMRALLEHGANVNKESSRGRTPLGEAILNKQAHLIPLLLEYRAIVSHVNRHGLSTLSIAEQMGDATILDVLAKREKLEQEQRRLFVAIGASDYDTMEELVAGGEMTYRDSHGWHLARELEESRANLARARTDLIEHIEIMNATIADTEAKQMRVVRLLDSMEYNKGQLAQVQTKETKLEAVRVHTETTVRDIVRKITAQDIINIISRPNPPEDLVVVLKAMALFQGILPKPKRLNETGAFSTHEWWETAQAMLMDRGFLRRLLDIHELAIEPDVLFKVRRECLKHDAFREIGAAELVVPEVLDAAPVVHKQRHGRRNAITNSTVDALGTWVKGVEMNQKARAEAKVLKERRESVLAEIHQLDIDLATATFDMKTAHRCLPSRQEELDRVVVVEQRAAAEFHLKTRRVLVCELLAFTSLNGHTPLSYAAAIGNERAVRILLSRGANGGHSDTERSLAAKLLQTTVRFHVQQAKYVGTNDAEAFRIVRYMAMRPIYKALRRCRQTQRVPLHEAAYNGHTDMLPLLVDVGHAPVWQPTYVEPTAMMPGQIEFGQPRRKDFGLHAWQVVLPPSRLTLDDSCRLGQSRFPYMPYRDGRGWDRIGSIYDATVNEVATIVVASSKHQNATRLEQLNRKTILRKTRHMRHMHDQLEAAIAAKDYVAASGLLDAGAFPDHATPAGMTLLMQAASEERFITNIDGVCVLMVEYLLDRKMGRPSPNFINTSLDGAFSHTALSVAAHYGTTMCGRMLVDRGADVNIQDPRFGQTALMHAAQNNKEDFVRFLLEHKANVHLKDVHGRSAFTFATERRNETVLGLLSEAAADMQQTLEIFNRLAAYGICRWGCGFVELRTAPVVEAGQGLVVAMRNPLQEHELHTCPKRIVTCPLGCDQPDLWSEEVPDHVVRQCPHRPLPCTHPKCGLTVAASRLRQHMQHDCIHRTVACPLCGEGSLAHKLDAHTKSCRLRLVPCPLCAMELRALDVSNHVKFECDCRDVRCRLGCGFVRLCDRSVHESDACVKRAIACVFACVDGTTPETQADHEQLCDHRPMVCPNRCGHTVRAIDVDTHLCECRYRFVPCTLGCGRRVRACDMAEHVSSLCTKRPVPCEWCGTQDIVATLLELHQRTECPHRIQACGVCGDGGILALDMTTHKTAECRMRPVECVFRRDGCMKTPLLAHEKTQHETFECKYRTIWCPLGCNEHLVARHLKAHEAICPMRFVVCTLGCGAELREKDRFEHEVYACIYNNKK